MSGAKLLPCPFCGSEPRKVKFDSYKEAVICGACGGRGPMAIYDTEGAARGWNRRSPTPESETTPAERSE